jgi:hypothetical protein
MNSSDRFLYILLIIGVGMHSSVRFVPALRAFLQAEVEMENATQCEGEYYVYNVRDIATIQTACAERL